MEIIPACKTESKSPSQSKAVRPAVNIITQELSEKITNAVLCFYKGISTIAGVKKIAYKPKGQIITIWTFIDDPQKNILFKIYSVEQQVIERFKDITFDFTVIFNSKESFPSSFYEMQVG